MSLSSFAIGGVSVPRILYGTAWKEDRTQQLCELALKCGFRGIDTANQRRHYHEAAVGAAIAASQQQGIVQREQLFLQSKFTFRGGQDHRLPYDAAAPIAVQVQQSFASSLEHLQTERLDSYLLHGPMQRVGLSADDWAAWQAMEEIRDSGRVRLLGVSNFTLAQLELLCQRCRIRPNFVQNRCYANRGWDRDVRDFCAAQQIVYQGFSLLTANPHVLAGAEIARIARRYGRTSAQIIFRFAVHVGMLPLSGTTSERHMQEDLEISEFELDEAEVETIARLV
jgi:diketogulonate reductase-like aldo/keto reductase